MNIIDRVKHAWNVFKSGEARYPPNGEPEVMQSRRRSTYTPSKTRFVSSIFARIAMDVSMTQINHVKINKENDDIKVIDSLLNRCFTVEANIDQTAIDFLNDIAFSLLDEGRIAVVPTITTLNPKVTGTYDIEEMRVAKILGFSPTGVKVNIYNDELGVDEQLWLPKRQVAIIQSPLYYMINEPNSTLQRLLHKMNILDSSDNAYSSNRLDIILQLPNPIRTEKALENAKQRIKNIDSQLNEGNNGIAYIDASEKVVQLNRSANPQILESIRELKAEFFNQLGLTQAIFDGTATEEQLRNYYNRTIDPLVSFILQEFKRKFLTKTAITQGHSIESYRNTLKFVSTEQLVNLADALRRNEIATSNEIRSVIGFKRSNDPLADKLANPNIAGANQLPIDEMTEGGENQNGEEVDNILDEMGF